VTPVTFARLEARARIGSHWRLTGTHKGEFNGIPPTNKRVSGRGCTVNEIKNGQFIKSATYSDQLALLQQIGAVGKGAGARQKLGRSAGELLFVRHASRNARSFLPINLGFRGHRHNS